MGAKPAPTYNTPILWGKDGADGIGRSGTQGANERQIAAYNVDLCAGRRTGWNFPVDYYPDGFKESPGTKVPGGSGVRKK